MNEEEQLLEDITKMNTQEPLNKIEDITGDTSKEKSEDIQKTVENQEKKEGKVSIIKEQDQIIEDAQNYAKDQIQSEEPDIRNNLEIKENQRIQGEYKEEGKQTRKETGKGERNMDYMED